MKTNVDKHETLITVHYFTNKYEINIIIISFALALSLR